MTARERLAEQLAAAGPECHADELGEDLEQVADFILIGTRRTATIRLDVWRDPATDTVAGVRYLHHDEDGCSRPEVVDVHPVTIETWRPGVGG